jgi:hypothetical protein
MKKRPEECAKAWVKSGISVAWDVDARRAVLAEAQVLHAQGVLFKSVTDKRTKGGAVPATMVAGAGVLEGKFQLDNQEASAVDQTALEEVQGSDSVFGSGGTAVKAGRAKTGRANKVGEKANPKAAI